jgi:hypothetical protein
MVTVEPLREDSTKRRKHCQWSGPKAARLNGAVKWLPDARDLICECPLIRIVKGLVNEVIV